MDLVNLYKEYNKWKMKERTTKLFIELNTKRLKKIKFELKRITNQIKPHLN